jgi:hypothetical protein
MAISIIQHNSSNPASVSPSLAFSSNVTQGSLLLVAVTYSITNDVTLVDTQGNVYVPLTEGNAGNTNTFFGRVFMAVATASGANTINTTSTSTVQDIFLNEIGGGVTGLDQFANGAGIGTAVASGSVTTTTANEFLFGFYFAGSGTTQTPGTGWTALDHQGATLNGFTQYQIASSTGSFNSTATLSAGKGGSPNWASQIVTFSNNAVAFPTGVSATAAEGTPGVGISVTPNGVGAVSGVGTPTVSAGATVFPAGVGVVSAVGTATAVGNWFLSFAGISVTSSTLSVASCSAVNGMAITGFVVKQG